MKLPSASTASSALVLLAALAAIAPLSAQNMQPGPANGGNGDAAAATATATEVTESPSIDGRLDEAVWRRAAALTGFTQRLPDDGQPATERKAVTCRPGIGKSSATERGRGSTASRSS